MRIFFFEILNSETKKVITEKELIVKTRKLAKSSELKEKDVVQAIKTVRKKR